MIDPVQRFSPINSALLQWRVGLEQFGNLTSQHTILTRLKVLRERKEIYEVGREYTGRIVYTARPVRGSDQSVLQDEFKRGERPFIPDARFILAEHYWNS